MKTIEEMLNWIRESVDLEAIGQESAETALFWFVAVHEVCNTHEGNTVKDWAHLLLDGHPKIDLGFCKGWLEYHLELCEDEDEEPDIEGMLSEFFDPHPLV